MASSNETVSMALFCDFENVALGVRDAKYDKFDIKLVLERLLLKGSIVVKKAYCDWDRYKSFKGAMHEANFELIEIPHVRQSGKNSADIRLVVDALDLCYTKSHVNTFVIISGDSDFSPLVSKLRENAKQVIGVGVQQSTSDLLIANCDEFFFYDDLVRENQRTVAKRESSRPQQASQPAQKRAPDEDKVRQKEDIEKRRTKAVEIAVQTFDALASERGDSGKIWASVLKNAIKRRKPDFNETYYGFRAFGNLLEEAHARGLLEFGRDEKSGAYVYRSAAANVGGDSVQESVEIVEPAEQTYEAQVAEAVSDAPAEKAEKLESGQKHETSAKHESSTRHETRAKHESAGKHESRRKDRGNRRTGRGQQDNVHEARIGVDPTAGEPTQARATNAPRNPSVAVDTVEAIEPDPIDPPSAARFATAHVDSIPGDVARNDETATIDQSTERETSRAPRKTAAKKTKKPKKNTPRTIDEVPEIAAPADVPAAPVALKTPNEVQAESTSAEPRTGLQKETSSEETPAAKQAAKPAAKKAARKTAPRSRRPRKAATGDAE